MGPIPKEAEALLQSEPLIAHLGTCHETVPHVAPLWYHYQNGVIEIATTGRKLENIRHNPKVALSVQKDKHGHPRWGVVCQGVAEIVDGNEDSIIARINQKYGEDEDAWSDNTAVRVRVKATDYWIY